MTISIRVILWYKAIRTQLPIISRSLSMIELLHDVDRVVPCLNYFKIGSI